jgi:hypothetical protein
LQAAYIECRFHFDNIRRERPEQQLEWLREFLRPSRSRQFSIGDLITAGSPISSRQSQKAAALLIDLSIVDIR